MFVKIGGIPSCVFIKKKTVTCDHQKLIRFAEGKKFLHSVPEVSLSRNWNRHLGPSYFALYTTPLVY